MAKKRKKTIDLKDLSDAQFEAVEAHLKECMAENIKDERAEVPDFVLAAYKDVMENAERRTSDDPGYIHYLIASRGHREADIWLDSGDGEHTDERKYGALLRVVKTEEFAKRCEDFQKEFKAPFEEIAQKIKAKEMELSQFEKLQLSIWNSARAFLKRAENMSDLEVYQCFYPDGAA